MKKIIFIALFALIANISFSQDCKYLVNGTDKFTGKTSKLTKPLKVVETLSAIVNFSVQREDTANGFLFHIDKTVVKSNGKNQININKGFQLMFVLEDGSVISLKSDENIISEISSTDQSDVFHVNLKNVHYPISKNQLDKFLISKVKNIRFYFISETGKEFYEDFEVKAKRQENIQELIKCTI